MPIPDNYKDVCEMLLEATKAGRVNWEEEGGSLVVRLPKYNIDIWTGTDEMDQKEFVALALKEPTSRGYVDNWYVEEGDNDFQTLKSLYQAARRHAHRVPQKLDELRKLLQSGDKLGLDDSDSMLDAFEARPGWKIVGNWEIPETETSNWELGPDWLRGRDSGRILWKSFLPKPCRIEFEACITSAKHDSATEFNVIVGDVTVLYYSAGVRLDLNTGETQREKLKMLTTISGTQLGKSYRYTVEVAENNVCALSIDGSRLEEFNCDQGRGWFTGRLGFGHWKDAIEVKNLRITTLKS